MGSMSEILFLLMPIAGATLLAMGIFQVIMDLRTSKQKKIVDRLSEYGGRGTEAKVRESLLRKHNGEEDRNALEVLVAKFSVTDKMKRLLAQADVPWSATRVLVNLSGLAVLVVVILLVIQLHPVACIGAGLAVFGLPIFWLAFKRKRRIKRLVEQLPDVFELMGQALRAGHGLASSVQLVSQQMPEPIAGEFARVFHEQNLGVTIEEALSNMSDRLDQMDVRFFVTAVLIQRQTGGDLAEILDKIGKVIRDRITLFGVVRALTAEGRLSGWVLLLLPVLVFCAILVVNPEYGAELTGTPNGRLMLGTAIAMDLMGMAMIKKIVNIKV